MMDEHAVPLTESVIFHPNASHNQAGNLTTQRENVTAVLSQAESDQIHSSLLPQSDPIHNKPSVQPQSPTRSQISYGSIYSKNIRSNRPHILGIINTPPH